MAVILVVNNTVLVLLIALFTRNADSSSGRFCKDIGILVKEPSANVCCYRDSLFGKRVEHACHAGIILDLLAGAAAPPPFLPSG